MSGQARIFVDHTHCGDRRVTGIERITQELFSREALDPLDVTIVRGGRPADMVLRQWFQLPALLARHPGSLLLCPGFPPSVPASLFGPRVLPYIHDLFLITQADHLNRRAKLYMAPSFRFAVARLPHFLVNSESTQRELRRFCRPDAQITLYRPQVRNVFGLSPTARPTPVAGPKLLALGTVEPRKNLKAAAEIVAALRAQGHPQASLHIVGRVGWGEDVDALSKCEGVKLHGYLSIEEIREMVAHSDALISTSHDEGLGLPLLEIQYAGIPVIAPDKPVFAEVLGTSGLLVDPAQPRHAASKIAAFFARPDVMREAQMTAAANLARWNKAASGDHAHVFDLIARLAKRNSP